MTAAGTAGRKAGQAASEEKVSQREEADDTRLQMSTGKLSSGLRQESRTHILLKCYYYWKKCSNYLDISE